MSSSGINLDSSGSIPKAIIFDVDGTLYNQKKLRLFMIFEMFKVLLFSPSKTGDLKIVWNFRKIREKNRYVTTCDLEEEQYNWGAQASGASSLRVRHVVQEWMYDRPLPYLLRCHHRGVKELFTLLKDKGIRIGIFSDYPADAKLKALGLDADAVVAATQKEVGRLKPDPKGLLIIAKKLGTPITNCLFIGDQDEKDGECARRAGMPCIILAPSSREQQFEEIHKWMKASVSPG
jgi:FMN phosphatase YigB (HAD superfamily)